ncbi:adenylate/guanylate cyclase domain-containing protein [Actinocorallia longicatena]|uniref:Adenylate/guanylate cyclase domain-containing protein n=2 Tax=Actinocorallia longicatena TaxID=111803 RepID=A0ABP6QQX8_9ACTN
MVEARSVEELLLGEPLIHTFPDVEALSGIPAEYGLRIWTALGFPMPPVDAVAFTEQDVEAMQEIASLLEHPFVDEAMVLQLARGVGQTMSRLASWLGEVWLRQLADQLLPPGGSVDEQIVADALAASAELRPRFEQLLLRGWRRQLAAAGVRVLTSTASSMADPAAGTATLAVGFADIVSFTRLSRRMDGAELASLIDSFETTCASVVAGRGGRVIKTLGDEVLFTAATPEDAAMIALEISAKVSEVEVRVGVAYGEVILRLGDVFGTPVNLAARLTATARPGAVLVAAEMAPFLDGFSLRALKPRPLQGLGRVRPYLLKEARATS